TTTTPPLSHAFDEDDEDNALLPLQQPIPSSSSSASASAIPASLASSSQSTKQLPPLTAGPKCIQVLETQPRRPITSICVNEGKLYAGGRDGTIVEWDATHGTVSRTFSHGHSKGITSICASGSRLFSSSEDGSVIGHDGYVTAVCVSPEGRLYSGGADRMINEWDPVTGRRQWILTGHTRWVLALCAAGGRLYSGGNDHTVRVWDMSNGRCLLVLEEHSDWVFSLCLGRDLLYSSSRDGTVRGHGETGVRAVCIAAGRLYSAGDDKAIVEWDVKSGKPTKTLGGHFGAVACLSLFGSGDCTVRVWEIGM
ncbi:WD40-repeat-containing domain protein, partial [Chytridium lagenaria]